MWSQTWTADVSDDCGNPATQFSVTYHWKVDVTPPVISQETGAADGTDLGCNPTVIPPTFSALDGCDGVLTSDLDVQTLGPVEGVDCMWSQTWTAEE
jgi:hypothetical protein